MAYPKTLENLIGQLGKLPGVGPRSAERMAFWLLNTSAEDARDLANGIFKLKENLQFCKKCNHLSDTDICSVCLDLSRDQTTVCVVENPKDLMAIEKSGLYKGIYHVLLGTIDPSAGKGPEDIKIGHLLNRVQNQDIKEVIIATDPDNEGEMTALYLVKQLKPLNVKVTRIGLGIPMGGAVEFTDISTLSMALTARREI
jgi:recombination protein RecR